MIVYHRTPAGEQILAEGFQDAEGTYLSSDFHRGVWVSDRPLDSNEGASGDWLLAVEVPKRVIVAFEWIEDEKPYREWLVPADVLNRYSVTAVRRPEAL